MNKIENSIGDIPIEKHVTIEKIVTENVEESPVKQTRYRGQDKKPRRMSVNSIRNLRPFQAISDSDKLGQYTGDYQKPASSSKLWIVFLILFGIVIGYLIWKYYKARQACNSDLGKADN